MRVEAPDDRGFDEMYQGTPPWDIGKPQPVLVEAAEKGEIRGSVLDVGCGTGEHALFFAARGHEAWGIDAAPTAIERAKLKMRERGLTATFVVGDALRLEDLGRTFDAVTDSGLFHVFADEQRLRFEASLRRALVPGGSYHVLCFSDREPGGWGPRRVSRAEIEATFARGWRIEYVREARFYHRFEPGWARGWFSRVTRLDDPAREPPSGARKRY